MNASTMTMEQIQTLASGYADTLAADDAAMAAIGLVIEAQHEVKMGPLNIERHFVRVFGDGLAAFPVPDSFGGNNPDKYPLPGKKNAKGSFYADLFDDLPNGKALKGKLDGISKALQNAADTPAEWKSKSTPWLKQEQQTIRQQHNSGARAVRMAMAFHFQVEKLAEFTTINVDVTYPSADRSTTYPVVIQSKAKVMDFKAFSVGALLSLDLDAAQDKGGSYEDIISTTKRAGATPENETSIKTFDQFEEAGADFLNYLEQLATDSKRIGALYKKLQSTENDSLLATVFGIAEELDKITSKPDLAKRYANLQARIAQDVKVA